MISSLHIVAGNDYAEWYGQPHKASELQGPCRYTMKPFLGFICTIMLYIVYKTTNYQYLQTELDSKLYRFYTSKADISTIYNLLAIPVGLKQKRNVNTIVQKFLQENFTIILFHYDGKLDGWQDLEWSNKAIHVVAQNQTKWWFAKRFLNPAVVSIYDYIFLWDEDLGVQHFNPKRWFAKRFLNPAVVSIYDYIFLWDEDLGVQHFNPKSDSPVENISVGQSSFSSVKKRATSIPTPAKESKRKLRKLPVEESVYEGFMKGL